MEYYWLSSELWGQQKPPARWVVEIIQEMLERLEGMTKEDDKAIASLSEEIAKRFLEKVKPASVNRGKELIEKAIATYRETEFASYLDLGAALALLAGLRPGEILRDAVLEPCSPYTVMLTSGQAKTRGQPGVKIIEAIASKLKKIEKQKPVSLQKKEPETALMRFLNSESQPETSEKTKSFVSDITPEVLGLSVEWVERLETVMEETGQTDLKAMVCELIKQEIKFREGMRSRHEGKDFGSMPLSQLKRTRHPEAASEKIRRAFLAIKYHNTNVATEKAQRWYINANSIHKLVGGRFSIITPWCDRHSDEIESHNQTYELTEGDNRKSVNITDVVIVPEMPRD